jgi:hypothetical protein
MTDTSNEAFQSVKPHLNDLQQKVLREIVAMDWIGMTPFEAIQKTGLLDYTLRPRITELKKLGRIKDSGSRRPNVRGRNEIVYVAA